MLRVLLGTGVLLMCVGFGAAGWQYWSTLPDDVVRAEADIVVAGKPPQTWLISDTGAPVPQGDASAYLVQDRFVPDRTVRVLREARLADLLDGDEQLPEAPFLEVLADIRAPMVSEGLCDRLLATVAQDCSVQTARVIDGSVDPVTGTARFRLDLVYRLKADGTELPDLATRVLRSEEIQLAPEIEAAGFESADAALAAALEMVKTACSAEGRGEHCRPLDITLDWAPGRPVSAAARIAWLDPLPKGMFVAPPLDIASGG